MMPTIKTERIKSMKKVNSLPFQDNVDTGEINESMSSENRGYARHDAHGNPELFETKFDSPLYTASDDLIRTRENLAVAKEKYVDAQIAWISEMKKLNKSKVNHQGNIVEFVRGRTTPDRVKFKKS